MAKWNPSKADAEAFCARVDKMAQSAWEDGPTMPQGEIFTKRASQMPPNKDVPHTYEQPARRTVYSKDPRLCKHQFANGRKVCPYCATTNPNL